MPNYANRNRRRGNRCRTSVAPETLAAAHMFLTNELKGNTSTNSLFTTIYEWAFGSTNDEGAKQKIAALEETVKEQSNQIKQILQYIDSEKNSLHQIVHPHKDDDEDEDEDFEDAKSTHSVTEELVAVHNESLNKLAAKAQARRDRLQEHARVLAKIRSEMNNKKHDIQLANEEIEREKQRLLQEEKEMMARINRSSHNKAYENLKKEYKKHWTENQHDLEEERTDPLVKVAKNVEKHYRNKHKPKPSMVAHGNVHPRKKDEDKEARMRNGDQEANEWAQKHMDLGKKYHINIWKE